MIKEGLESEGGGVSPSMVYNERGCSVYLRRVYNDKIANLNEESNNIRRLVRSRGSREYKIRYINLQKCLKA